MQESEDSAVVEPGRSGIMEILIFGAIFVGLVLLQVWLFPKMGIGT